MSMFPFLIVIRPMTRTTPHAWTPQTWMSECPLALTPSHLQDLLHTKTVFYFLFYVWLFSYKSILPMKQASMLPHIIFWFCHSLAFLFLVASQWIYNHNKELRHQWTITTMHPCCIQTILMEIALFCILVPARIILDAMLDRLGLPKAILHSLGQSSTSYFWILLIWRSYRRPTDLQQQIEDSENRIRKLGKRWHKTLNTTSQFATDLQTTIDKNLSPKCTDAVYDLNVFLLQV